jgi:hypothetical protein
MLGICKLLLLVVLFSDRQRNCVGNAQRREVSLHLQLQVANPPSATDTSFSPFTTRPILIDTG